MFDGPYYKKSKIENESNGSHSATGDGSLIPTDTDELSLFDQPQNIFRQVSNSTKLPKTAFVIFLNSSKDAYFAQHPEASFKEFQSDSLVTWHALSSSEKTVRLHTYLTLILTFLPDLVAKGN